ncbi:type II secretion system protein [Isachenkonia alkalipeptolytica]|uniref:Type II secretion system protein n=1 Tax=Isachenkonia alkalipeptolytica TaxID=2565777 RepID=A0AA43XM62_9CLOT|nr:type II secretion system protein [Isachenkonia alkalipeptolytica]NBG88794.1 type II secretion system protein [Isachenkonia alkalipeptolytica]
MGNNKGFTLIELITVMAILTILMGIAVPRTYHIRENAALNVDINNGKLIKNNIDIYYSIYEKWPQSSEDIFGPGRYLSDPPIVQSRNGVFLIDNKGRVQVISGNEVYWCSSGTTTRITVNILK